MRNAVFSVSLDGVVKCFMGQYLYSLYSTALHFSDNIPASSLRFLDFKAGISFFNRFDPAFSPRTSAQEHTDVEISSDMFLSMIVLRS